MFWVLYNYICNDHQPISSHQDEGYSSALACSEQADSRTVGELTDGFTDGWLAVGAGWCAVEWEANMRARPESACSWKH